MIEFEVHSVEGSDISNFDTLREAVEHIRAKTYENFVIIIENAGHRYDEILDDVQHQVWSVFELKNVDDIS